MSNNVYLMDDRGNMKEMVHSAYESEAILQSLVADHPQLLAGEQMDREKPRKWVLVSREMGVSDDENAPDRWSIDHLFLDQEAVPTLVEVKRSTDTRIRREVVGQMMDYAANAILYWPVETLIASLEKTCGARGLEVDAVLATVLEGRTPEEYWGMVKTNLKAGRIRMLFLADRIPTELRRIVEFLNQQMDPAEVLAIEVNRYMGEGHTAVVPVLLGNTLESQNRKQSGARPTRQWDKVDFLDEILRRHGAKVHAAVRKVIEWTEENGMRPWWGKGAQDGSYIPAIDKGDEHYLPWAIWSYGKIEIQFQYLKGLSAFASRESREELATRLRSIKGISIPGDSLERRPSFPMNVLIQEGNLDAFIGVMAWVKQAILGS